MSRAGSRNRRIGGLVRALAILASLLAALAPAAARAHPLGFTEMRAELHANRTYRIDVLFDADALIAGADPGHMTEEDWGRVRAMPPEEIRRLTEDLRAALSRSLSVRVDGREAAATVTFPQAGEPEAGAGPGETTPAPGAAMPPLPGAAGIPPTPGGVIRYSGALAPNAREITITPGEPFGTVLLAVARDGDTEATRQVLEPGRTSEPYRVSGEAPPRLGVALQYLRLGFEHILPKGLDHILFVIGLFLLSARLGPLLKQVTAFTVAHSISLALSIYGIVSLPPSIVEPLIALSIACVAIENLFTSDLKPWRPFVVFLFGLLHGLGFAGVLSELGLPRGEFLTALLTFNVGVELGQLSVIAIALLLVGRFRTRGWYRSRVVVPVSCAIALVGLYWSFERAGVGAWLASALFGGRASAR